MKHFDAKQIAAALPWPELIESLRRGFIAGCEQPLRHHHRIDAAGEPDATLLLMPAWRSGHLLGVKIATVFPGNATRDRGAVEATYVLSSAVTGEPLAVLDGLELTLRRTAAASALAATFLAHPGSRQLLVVGAGRLAPYLVAAHSNVLGLQNVEVWARRPEQARELCATLEQKDLGARVAQARPVADLESAVRRADVISCATLAQEPLVRGAWLRPGSHLDLVGGYTPSMRECDDEAIRRATVFVDTRAGAMVEAGDLVQPLESGVMKAEDVRADLFGLARGEHAGRGVHADLDAEITLFKSVGAALEDLAAASLVWERSQSGD